MSDIRSRIDQNIELFWGTPHLSGYIVGLLNDSRDGHRQGFPPEITDYLFKKLKEHDEAYPNLAQ